MILFSLFTIFFSYFRGENTLGQTPISTTKPSPPAAEPTPTSQATTPQSSAYETPRPRPTTHHGYSDSTLSSGRSSDDGRSSYLGNHSRQESAELYSLRHEGHTSSGDEPHSRNSSHDSSDLSASGKICEIVSLIQIIVSAKIKVSHSCLINNLLQPS